MEDALISVIIPIYKVEQYLQRCVDSVLKQSYEKLEIILVDDGSPDGCGAICDKISEKDSRVRVIHKCNGGLSDARNVGMKYATGEYFLFVDSDDYIHCDMIQYLYDCIKSSGAEIALCGYDIFDEKGNFTSVEFQVADNYIVLTGAEAAKRMLFLHEPQMVVAWNKLTKRELWKNRSFPVGKQHEDDFTSYQILFEANKVVVTNRPYYHYFQRFDSITGVGFNLCSLHKIEAYLAAKEYFKNKDCELYDRACNMVLIMNMVCIQEAQSSEYPDKEHIIKELRRNGRKFYLENWKSIKRGLKYHLRLIRFYFGKAV